MADLIRFLSKPQTVVSGVNPIAVPRQEPYIQPSGMLEQITGSDFDSSSLSPREMSQWYSNPAYGKDDAHHKRYIANAEKLLDQPLIPEAAARATLGYRMVYGDRTGDMTLREYMQMAPILAEYKALKAVKDAPDEQSKASAKYELAGIEKANAAFEEASGPVTAENVMEHPIARQAWGQLTGQNESWSSPVGKWVSGEMLGAIKSGVTGGKYETDPTVSPEQFAEMEGKYGEEANRMLTEGGLKNIQREAALDLLSAAQDTPGLNPHIDNASSVMSVVGHNLPYGGFPQGYRAAAMMDQSPLRGRMALANDRFERATKSFSDQAESPEKPYVVQADNFNRLDTGSYGGLLNAMGNSSWGYGRNIANPFSQFMGEAVTRSFLKDNLLDQRPLAFLQDVADKSFRETPIRLPGQTYEQNAETRNFVADRRAARHDYLPTHGRAMLADAYNGYKNDLYPHLKHNISRTPTNFEATSYGLPQAIIESPIQIGMAAGSLGQSLPAFAATWANEALQENIEDKLQNPSGSRGWFDKREGSAWMKPDPPGTPVMGDDGKPRRRTTSEYAQMLDADNTQAWEQGVEETNRRRYTDLTDQYRQWQQANPPKTQATGAGFTVN
jgi:hypothetical protein